MKTTDYTPIACTEYSRYELAVMHHRKLRLVWAENDVLHCDILVPVDLLTRNSEEFLVCVNSAGDKIAIRLDKIRRTRLA